MKGNIDMILHYSTFRYTTIPLGIIFYVPGEDIQTFTYTDNFSPIKEIDDEIDLKLVRCLLLGIKEDVEVQKDFSIREFTRYYVNEFRFDDERTVETEDIDETIRQLKSSILTQK